MISKDRLQYHLFCHEYADIGGDNEDITPFT